MSEEIYSKAGEMIREGRPGVLCIVTGTRGSTPRKAGAAMIVAADGALYGTIGGGRIEKTVVEKAAGMMSGASPEHHSFDLDDDLSMHCGGAMDVYMEPLEPTFRLVIFGAGHIGAVLARYAHEFGFRVVLVDPREQVPGPERPAEADFECMPFLEATEKLQYNDRTFIVIVTPGHVMDEEILAAVARKPHAYIGLIGSRQKVALLKKRFLAENILTTVELDAVDMPIGIRFRAETPQEIAISILAKLIDVRNRLREPS